MSNPPNIPRLVAILIGINKYKHFEELKSGVDDALKLKTFLIDEYHVDPKDIILLTDSAATRDNIIGAIESLRETPERDNAILFFFSGYAGNARGENNSQVGMICPADMNKDPSPSGNEIPGIPDVTLTQLFESVSKIRGNNITVLLDCASRIFTWNNPSSFIVIAPERAMEINRAGVFTKSLIDVLRSEKHSIQSLTAQSFAHRIQWNLDTEVHCYGQNADSLLFNPKKGKAYHAFILGKTVPAGGIMLAAGSAHGVQKGTIYGIYHRNVQASDYKRLGYLRVSSVDSSISSTLCFSGTNPSFPLTDVFYAVEIRYPDEKVAILFRDTTPDRIGLKPAQCWEQVTESKDANITLQVAEGLVRFSWNGVTNDSQRMRATDPDRSFSVSINDVNRIARTIRNAARFMYHLTRSSTNDSLLSVNAQIQQIDRNGRLKKIDMVRDGLVEVDVEKGKQYDSCCLILRNNSEIPVWLFVFTFDSRFNILPWYAPASMAEPLGAGKELTIGCDENALPISWRPGRKTEIYYIKVFVSSKRTSLSSVTQYFRSFHEAKLREAEGVQLEPLDGENSLGGPKDDTREEDDPDPQPSTPVGKDWATVLITFRQNFRTH